MRVLVCFGDFRRWRIFLRSPPAKRAFRSPSAECELRHNRVRGHGGIKSEVGHHANKKAHAMRVLVCVVTHRRLELRTP